MNEKDVIDFINKNLGKIIEIDYTLGLYTNYERHETEKYDTSIERKLKYLKHIVSDSEVDVHSIKIINNE